MPMEFLTDAQVAGYGRFDGVPSRADLERFFVTHDTSAIPSCSPRYSTTGHGTSTGAHDGVDNLCQHRHWPVLPSPGPRVVVAVEGTRSYGAGLARLLTALDTAGVGGGAVDAAAVWVAIEPVASRAQITAAVATVEELRHDQHRTP